jgi:predicted nucleotidyltransferase
MILNKQSNIATHSRKKRTPYIYTLEEQAVLTTLLYSDIFSFPLTKDEIWKYLISPKTIDKKSFSKSLELLNHQLVSKYGYYTFSGKEYLFQKRHEQLPIVANKLKLARKVAEILGKIPTVQFVGVSGSLAAGKADTNDDIDFFIITKANTVYTSRFFILLLLQIMGLRRSRQQTKAQDKICVNLLLDESNLVWDENKRDVYTAREIAQIQPLFERDNVFANFLKANAWVKQFLPNALNIKEQEYIHGKSYKLSSSIVGSYPIELLMRSLQRLVINRHKTTETVTNHQLAFHPRDYRLETLRQLKLKMRDLGLLTNL